ncbi:hypothetical protein BJ944DRAFT_274187 [Cunninghamella echinulata]|nr:hypothetical protein BJ944DRAFT_274187 [Cunninghamella echinulata]
MRLPTLSALGIFILSTSQFVSAKEDKVDYYLTGHGNNHARGLDIKADSSSIDLSAKTIHFMKRGVECTKYHTVSGKDTCITVSKKYGIQLDQFYQWNQQVDNGCSNLNNGKKYCVAVKSSSSSSSGCAKTHTVTSSDTCVGLAKQYGLELNDFYDLNPKVHRGSCDNLDNGKKYCVKKGDSSNNHKNDDDDEDDKQVHALSNKVANFGAKTHKKESKKNRNKKGKLLQSKASFTYYWIATPDDYKSSGKKVTIKTCSGKSLGKVAENYADALVMEGTGVLGSSIVNLGGCNCSGYKCFEEVDKKDDPFGLTSYSTPLRPYVTIATNDIPRGTKLYVPELDGWTLPNSDKKHNGCLVSDDQSWSFGGKHIDFYVYKQSHYKTLDKEHRITKVDIYENEDCEIQDYM